MVLLLGSIQNKESNSKSIHRQFGQLPVVKMKDHCYVPELVLEEEVERRKQSLELLADKERVNELLVTQKNRAKLR